jgi:choline dehydrogenase-like flavoprotein
MTIIRCSEAIPQSLLTNICIVGAGAAGITLACELSNTSLSVLVLEAGGFATNAGLASEFSGFSDFPHPEPSLFREFVFGGTTRLWGGRCVPFDPIDFDVREHVPNSGWPIRYEEVARFYQRALTYCEAGAFDFSIAGSLDVPHSTIAGTPENDFFLERIERYSMPTDFGARYRKTIKLSKNVTVLLNARCTELMRRSGEDSIGAAHIAYPNGVRRRVIADVFVLAIGGIETPRLLFASDPEGSGLGNATDKLGRFYMCHFENTCARLLANGTPIRFGFEKTRDGVYCRRKIQILPAAQRVHHLLNTSFRLHFTHYSDASHGSSVMSAIFLIKGLLRKEYQQMVDGQTNTASRSHTSEHLLNILAGLPQLAKFGLDLALFRYLARRKLPYTLVPNSDASFPLELNSEQTPIESSRIKPTGEVDSFGIRRVAVGWRVRNEDLEAAYRALQLLKSRFAKHTKIGLEMDENLVLSQIQRSPPIKGHHIGTARMAATSSKGVVDENCKVFGLRNLFVAGSAVFPTSSHANPTLTIVALAVRLANHLRMLATGREIEI